jgi:disulfide bond formation protein DsbB
MLGSAGLAGYHAGIERGLWSGPSACAAPVPTGGDAGALLDRILETPVVRCDEVAWQMLGLSMAEWNGLVSLALAGVWLWSARAPEDAHLR